MICKTLVAAACLFAGVAVLALAQTQADLNDQARAEFKKADAMLNKVYGELRARLDDKEKARLKEVQLLWLKYRDANADFAASQFEGGSIAPLIYSSAMTSTTEDRVRELKGLFMEGYPEESATP